MISKQLVHFVRYLPKLTKPVKPLTKGKLAARDYASEIDRLGKKASATTGNLGRLKKNAFRGAGAGAGAAAAFSGIPGLGSVVSGAGLGFAAGGPAGALFGGLAAGAVEGTQALTRFGAQAAVTAAEIDKLELALSNVTGSEFTQALNVIRGTVDDFNTPLDVATRNFTTLAAAGKSAGFNLQELESVYRGLSAANKALGGDTE